VGAVLFFVAPPGPMGVGASRGMFSGRVWQFETQK
jgi:hypothetical protein